MKSKDTLSLPLSKVKEVYNKYLYIENEEIIDIIFACYVANQLAMDPLWMLIIAPPSTTKTEALRRIRQQMPLRQKLQYADTVLDGTWSRPRLRVAVESLYRTYQKEARQQGPKRSLT